MAKRARSRRKTVASDRPAVIAAKVRELRQTEATAAAERRLSDAYRNALREYRNLVLSDENPGAAWTRLARESLISLGGEPDRRRTSLLDYDHRRYGPFLGVSDEGSSAPAVRKAALNAPKGEALARKKQPVRIGVALDGERLGGVGELPVGPNEFAHIWSECTNRILMTTNIGSRVNLRHYKRASVVTITDEMKAPLEATKTALDAIFKPFSDAPGGPRPLVALVQFPYDSRRPAEEKALLLKALQRHVSASENGKLRLHELGLAAIIGVETKGCSDAIAAIDLARQTKIRHVTIEGSVRKQADQTISLPGLLNYLPDALAHQVIVHARAANVSVRAINQVDADTVARDIWSSLATARAFGVDLGKYGLVPLTLEECDHVVKQVQGWFPEWAAAPVFYIDQGLISDDGVFTGANVVEGARTWLHTVARHKVKIVLIDTVDKSLGWKILKTNGDPKGLLDPSQIAELDKLAAGLGIKTLWAGGITLDQAYDFGKLGVFGIYVTTAASEPIPVDGDYSGDPALPSVKEPTYEGVLKVKTLLEAGFLAAELARSRAGPVPKRQRLRERIEQAELDPGKLSEVLVDAWRFYWRSTSE